MVYSFSYDGSGNPLTSKVGDASTFMKSSAEYTPNGNYMKSLTDSSGNAITYNYNETKGVLDSINDPKGKTTAYSYDPLLDRLKSVSKVADGQTIINSYDYLNDRISAVTHNGFSYKFGYDALGNNNNKVDVGTQNLITNIFEARTSNLLKSIYGNSQSVSSKYDSLDRIITKLYNNDGIKVKRLIAVNVTSY